MPLFADEEIAAVSNYVIRHFGGKQGKVTAAEVRARGTEADCRLSGDPRMK
jgi:hypothetical protein